MSKNYKVIPIEFIVPRKEQYKIMHIDKKNALKTSLISLGQTRSIHVREIGTNVFEIIEGTNIFECLKEIGATSVVCYNYGIINDLEAKKVYLQLDIVDSSSDFIVLSRLVNDLLEQYDVNKIAQFMGYSITEVKDLIKLKNYNWDNFNMEESQQPQGLLFD